MMKTLGFVFMGVTLAMAAATCGGYEPPPGGGGSGGGGATDAGATDTGATDAGDCPDSGELEGLCKDAWYHILDCVPDGGLDGGIETLVDGGIDAGPCVSVPECKGEVECQAKCTLEASCETITGNDPQGLHAYTICLAECTSPR